MSKYFLFKLNLNANHEDTNCNQPQDKKKKVIWCGITTNAFKLVATNGNQGLLQQCGLKLPPIEGSS